MIVLLYKILLVYFFIGAIITYFINRDKQTDTKKNSWLKFSVYLLIINIVIASIYFDKRLFSYISLLIIIVGFYELVSNTIKTKKEKVGFAVIPIFLLISYFFYISSELNQNYLFYSLFMVVVFDGFSQLSGQLFGKKKMFLKISPNKTYAGLFGGFTISIITSIFIRDLLKMDVFIAIYVGFGISLCAFIGDTLASLIKRKFGIKDYSNLIPGHGGFLDRFDSLIFGTIFILFLTTYFNL